MLTASSPRATRLRADNGVRIVAPGDEARWNLVFPRGTWHGANLASLGGSIDLTDALFAELVTNWTAAGRPSLPIWWNHPDDDAAFSGVPAEERKKAAGWIEDLRVGVDGLEALTKWTPAARARIEADEYRFFSPEWAAQHTDRRTGETRGWWLYGVALLNDPFFNEMPRVAAAVPAQPNPQTKRKTMDKKLICTWLGLPEDTDDAKVMAALQAKCQGGDISGDKLTAAVREGVELVAKPMREALEAAKKETEALKASLAKAAEEKLAADCTALCDELVKAGQVLPAHREKVTAFAKRTSLAEAREVYGALPKSPPPGGELGLSTATAPTGDVAALKGEYEAELDKAMKAGEALQTATRRLRADPKFRPYLIASQKSLTTKSQEN